MLAYTNFNSLELARKSGEGGERKGGERKGGRGGRKEEGGRKGGHEGGLTVQWSMGHESKGC